MIIDVSIIIVNYNTRQMTAECIDSIFEKTSGVSLEVILVDNASKDDSREFFSADNRITYIYNDENIGFGRANNLGNSYASGKYLLLLNSDTLLVDNSIKAMYDFMESNVGIVSCGGNLISETGRMVISHGKFPSLKQEFSVIGFYKLYNNFYRQKIALGQLANEGNTDNVDYISGADIFIRKDIFDEIGGFDKDYFMYYEETDLYYRMHDLGYKSCIIPDIKIIHKEGGSFVKKSYNLSRFKLLYCSKLLFYTKHQSVFAIVAMRIMTALFIISHFYILKFDTIEALRITFTMRIKNNNKNHDY